MMGETLVTDSIELGRKKDTELVKLILEKEGDFVAITKNGLFWNLGDLKDLVEQSVRRFTRTGRLELEPFNLYRFRPPYS